MNRCEQRLGYWWGAALIIATCWAGMRAAHCVVPVYASALAAPSVALQVATLEARLGDNPSDLEAAQRLAQLFLSAGAPGQAEAVLRWTTPALHADPRIASLRVQSLSALGEVDRALALQRSILASCAGECEPTLFAHGKYRERVLAELQRAGVTDSTRQPARVALAYNRATRSVQLAN